MAKSTDQNKNLVKNLSSKSAEYISLLKGELLSNHKAATHGLVNSLEYKLYDKGTSIHIDWLYADYGTWVRSGKTTQANIPINSNAAARRIFLAVLP